MFYVSILNQIKLLPFDIFFFGRGLSSFEVARIWVNIYQLLTLVFSSLYTLEATQFYFNCHCWQFYSEFHHPHHQLLENKTKIEVPPVQDDKWRIAFQVWKGQDQCHRLYSSFFTGSSSLQMANGRIESKERVQQSACELNIAE